MRIACDAVVVGAGVCGLWARYALSLVGMRVVTLERSAMGDGQTVASQGILHRGAKFNDSSAAREELGRVYDVWISALAGTSGPDLRQVRVLSPRMFMWSTPSMAARAKGAVAAGAMVSTVRRLRTEEFPPEFRGAPSEVSVWVVDEIVVDARSLLVELARSATGPIVRASSFSIARMGGRVLVGLDGGHEIEAGHLVLCAGAGNEALLGSMGEDGPGIMQRRALHQVVVRGARIPIYGHCMDAQLSRKPRLTVTSTPEAGGTWTWYLGGNLAEVGVDRDEASQIDAAREELRACLSWIDTDGLRFETLRIDRAEGRTPEGRRPDAPVVRRFGRVLAAWPTKLALAPVAADEVVRLAVDGSGERVSEGEWRHAEMALRGREPGVAPLAWECRA